MTNLDGTLLNYDSLYTLFAGILENNKNGNYTYNAQGMLDVDYDRSSLLMKELNPASGYWKLF